MPPVALSPRRRTRRFAILYAIAWLPYLAVYASAMAVSGEALVHVAILALNAGADGIVAHLREDRRHIRERDVEILRATVPLFGLEFARAPDIVAFALEIQPDLAMLVPERREELTTEGGLDVVAELDEICEVVVSFQEKGIPVSLFIDPDDAQIEAAGKTGARFVELHTEPVRLGI